MIDPNTAEQKEIDEHNAVAWLQLTDHELIERSGSLGLPGYLHPTGDGDGTLPTSAQIVQARRAADDHARVNAGDKFVDEWIKENR